VARPGLTSLNLADAVSALPRFQREIRRLFAHRVSVEQLDKQDRQELKEFNALLPLWNAYLANPGAHWPDAAQRTKAMADRPLGQAQMQIKRALRTLEPEGVRAQILSQPTDWEDAPALWIALDSENPVHALNPTALLKPVLRQAVLAANLNDEQNSTLQRRCANVVILAAFKGRSLDRQAWILPIYRLTAEDRSSEYAWLDNIPRPLSDADWMLTDLYCWSTPEITESRALLHVIGRFKVLADHLSGCLTLARSEVADREILQGYLDRYESEWSGVIEALVESIGALAERCNQLTVCEQEQRPLLVEAAIAARDHFHDWLPPGLDEGHAVLSVDACAKWLNTVAAHIDTLVSFGGAVLIDTLAQIAIPSGHEEALPPPGA